MYWYCVEHHAIWWLVGQIRYSVIKNTFDFVLSFACSYWFVFSYTLRMHQTLANGRTQYTLVCTYILNIFWSIS